MHDHDSYGNYGKKGYSDGYRGPQYRAGKHDYAKDGYGDYHGAKMHGYEGYDNYGKKGYADDYHGPQYGVGKYDHDQGRSYDGETDHYALLEVTGLKRAAGDVYPNIHDNGVHAQSKDRHDVYYATSNHDGDYGNSYDYAHSTAKDEYNDHDRPSAYGNGDHGNDGGYRYSQDNTHNRGDGYVESNYGKYEYYGEMDNDAHSKEGEYYGKIKDYAHAKGAEYYGKQEDSAYGQKQQYYGNADNYANAKAGKHYGKVDDFSYAKEGKLHGKVHDKYPKETTHQSYSYSDAEK